LVSVGPQRLELLLSAVIQLVGEQHDIDSCDAVDLRLSEGFKTRDLLQFGGRPDEHGHVIAQNLPESFLDLPFEYSDVRGSRLKRHVPTRDERCNPGEAKRLENLAQKVHLDDVAPAGVNRPQECDQSLHYARGARTRISSLPPRWNSY